MHRLQWHGPRTPNTARVLTYHTLLAPAWETAAPALEESMARVGARAGAGRLVNFRIYRHPPVPQDISSVAPSVCTSVCTSGCPSAATARRWLPQVDDLMFEDFVLLSVRELQRVEPELDEPLHGLLGEQVLLVLQLVP